MNSTFTREGNLYFHNNAEKLIFFLVTIFDALTAFISIIIFSKEEFKELVYKYIKLELVIWFIYSIQSLFLPYLYNFEFAFAYYVQWISFVSFGFLFNIWSTVYFYLNILSSLSCYLLVKNKTSTKLYKLLSYHKLSFMIIFAFGVIMYSYLFFMYEIKLFYENSTNNQTYFYAVSQNEISLSNTGIIIEVVVFLIRDGLGLILVLIINLILLIDFRKIMRNKKAILKYKTDTRVNKNSENKLVLITLLNFLVGIMIHVPYLLFIIIKNFASLVIDSPILKILIKVFLFSTQVSYCFNIFSFYFGNKRFRHHLNAKRFLRLTGRN